MKPSRKKLQDFPILLDPYQKILQVFVLFIKEFPDVDAKRE